MKPEGSAGLNLESSNTEEDLYFAGGSPPLRKTVAALAAVALVGLATVPAVVLLRDRGPTVAELGVSATNPLGYPDLIEAWLRGKGFMASKHANSSVVFPHLPPDTELVEHFQPEQASLQPRYRILIARKSLGEILAIRVIYWTRIKGDSREIDCITEEFARRLWHETAAGEPTFYDAPEDGTSISSSPMRALFENDRMLVIWKRSNAIGLDVHRLTYLLK